MSTTYTSLFRRKSLAGVLTQFAKAQAGLDEFIAQAEGDKLGLSKEADRIAAETEALNLDIAHAERVKAKIADLVA